MRMATGRRKPRGETQGGGGYRRVLARFLVRRGNLPTDLCRLGDAFGVAAALVLARPLPGVGSCSLFTVCWAPAVTPPAAGPACSTIVLFQRQLLYIRID